MSHHRYAVAANARRAGWTAALLCLVILLNFSGVAAADDKCGYPDIFGAMMVPPENRLGEFRISLEPPDYQDVKSIKEHLVFSSTWGRLLKSALRAKTRGICDAITTSSLFPDLWTYLITNRPSRQPDVDTSQCIVALQEVLQEFKPDPAAIRRGASEEAAIILSFSANPGDGVVIGVSNILTEALTYIYRADTVMHALVSIDARLLRSLDTDAFLGWLDKQRSPGYNRLSGLSLCPPGIGPQRSFAESRGEPFPVSSTIPPRPLKLLVKEIGQTPPALRHVVIVGLNAPLSVVAGLNTPFSIPATDKYCNREHRFSGGSNVDTADIVAVRVRCLTQVRYSRSWLLFYCEPGDCASERTAESVAHAIATDPDVLALARDNAENGQSKGPYLVSVTTGE